uniref:gamma-glutamylcyclotransferase n=1 Tax=Pararhizobium sp. IMCC3301 TaxID=3067904 RepID=UPI0027412793|nr:gamma-glutamylcyclotransferase [Pararhizobium sp. IMCC3301]
MRHFWVFGYGSLMWRPGFAYARCETALLYGAHRSLCVYSYVHRGTPERPGLVLGLDRGGTCKGLAFAVEPENWQATLAYLRKREQATMVYKEATRTVRLASGESVSALSYLVDRDHEQYAGKLDLQEQLALVQASHGQSGPNTDYVMNTQAHLKETGTHDPALSWLTRQLQSGS